MTEYVSRVFRTMGLQIGIRYENSPVCVPDGTEAPPDDPADYIATARPGARAPHVALPDGRSTLDLFGRGFVLMDMATAGESPANVAELEKAAQAIKLPIRIERITEPAVRKVYEKKLALVRPDGHVAWRGDAIPHGVAALIDRVRGA